MPKHTILHTEDSIENGTKQYFGPYRQIPGTKENGPIQDIVPQNPKAFRS